MATNCFAISGGTCACAAIKPPIAIAPQKNVFEIDPTRTSNSQKVYRTDRRSHASHFPCPVVYDRPPMYTRVHHKESSMKTIESIVIALALVAMTATAQTPHMP